MPTWMRWITDLFQTVEHQWLAGVVSFDNSSRDYLTRKLFSDLKDGGASAVAYLGHLAQALGSGLVDRQVPVARRVLNWLMLLGLGGGSGWLIWRIRRVHNAPLTQLLRKLPAAERQRLRVDLAFYNDLIRILESTGIRRKIAQTPSEYVEATIQDYPAVVEEARWLIDTFYEIRFGDVRPSAITQASIAQRLLRIRQEMRESRR
jgi:hypothetical protein